MRVRGLAIILTIAALHSTTTPAFATQIPSVNSDAAVAIPAQALPSLAQRLQTLLPGGAERAAQAATTATVNAVSAITARRMQERAAAARRAARSRALAAIRHLATPAYGRISVGFGARGFWSNRHTGIDIAARYGSAVHSVVAGRVIASAYAGSYGNVVVVRGHGVDIWYAHLSKRSVKVGQNVGFDQTLGNVGCTGHCTGPHLHLEVRKNGLPTDPTTFLWGSHRGLAGPAPAWARNHIETLSNL
ncbi:MAG: M23 family metallopeptidase [Candidatus Nanopelagicales bacterium]